MRIERLAETCPFGQRQIGPGIDAMVVALAAWTRGYEL
jgi:hypothetical protein